MSIRRILVALDASAHSLAALEAAANVAAQLEAELSGLFVEDITLLHLAGLPFAREVGFPSAMSRPLNGNSVERMLRTMAIQARAALGAVAEKRNLRWSFQVARGSVVAELLRAAVEADLLALGVAGHGLTSRTRLGSTALSILTRAPANVLLLHQGCQIKAPALIVLDCSPAALSAFPTALVLAAVSAGPLGIFILADEPGLAQKRWDQIAPVLAAKGLDARRRSLRSQDLGQLAQIAKAEGAGVVIVAADSRFLENGSLQAALQDLPCPAFIVRRPIIS